MKRLIIILLAALLTFSVLGAGALDYTLDEKLFRQVRDGSGLKAAIKVEKTGGGISILDPRGQRSAQCLKRQRAVPALSPGGRYPEGDGRTGAHPCQGRADAG